MLLLTKTINVEEEMWGKLTILKVRLQKGDLDEVIKELIERSNVDPGECIFEVGK